MKPQKPKIFLILWEEYKTKVFCSAENEYAEELVEICTQHNLLL